MNDLFNKIDQLAIDTYGGKKVLFIVPNIIWDEINWNEWMHKNEIKSDYLILFPEKNLSVNEQREYVFEKIIPIKKEHIIIVTFSPFILSDAFSSQILKINESGKISLVSFPTFGSEIGRICLHVFGSDESIGRLADKTLDKMLEKTDWTTDSLKNAISNIGGGWPRAELREKLNKLMGN
jgi:hypothetical protein